MKRRILLFVVLFVFWGIVVVFGPTILIAAVGIEETLKEAPFPVQVEEFEPSGCQWFWVRETNQASMGWFALDEQGLLESDRPVKFLKYPGGDFVFPDLSLEVFRNPDKPPSFIELVGCAPWRAGNLGTVGCEYSSIGRWEWACG